MKAGKQRPAFYSPFRLHPSSLFFYELTSIEALLFPLHGLLFVCERDAHLFERHLVESARHLYPFGLLILLQTRARIIVELSRLLARIEVALLENRLRLLDLILVGAEDGAALLCICVSGLGRCVSVRLTGITVLRHRGNREGH